MFLCTSRGTKKIGVKLKNEHIFPCYFAYLALFLAKKLKKKKPKKTKKKNRVPSILGLHLKVTVFLLIFAYLLKLLFYYL